MPALAARTTTVADAYHILGFTTRAAVKAIAPGDWDTDLTAMELFLLELCADLPRPVKEVAAM